FGGPARLVAAGLHENVLQALGQGILAGPAALYLFAISIQLLGAGRAAVFPAMVPALALLVGWLLIGEAPTALQGAGLFTVLLVFSLAQRQSWRALGHVGPPALLFGGCKRIEIDELRIVGGGLGLAVAAAMDMHQGLHPPRVDIIGVLMPQRQR